MKILRFGIPSLDRLLGHCSSKSRRPPEVNELGIYSSDSDRSSTSFCIVGHHGSGKSVLALHLASRYLADTIEEVEKRAQEPGQTDVAMDATNWPKVIYISTDLGLGKAEEVWENFGLGFPNLRPNPFEEKTYSSHPIFLDIQGVTAGDPAEIARCLDPIRKSSFLFVDLARSGSGDDWGLLTRILAQLETPDQSPHMLFIDAIEGFETLIGERDAFGEKLSRRSRIAQIVRLARDKAHVVFICEEANEGTRLPEEFAADVVVRLRNVEFNRYSRRTIELEKVRGQAHARGKHPFAIRKGTGSTTGELRKPNETGQTKDGGPAHAASSTEAGNAYCQYASEPTDPTYVGPPSDTASNPLADGNTPVANVGETTSAPLWLEEYEKYLINCDDPPVFLPKKSERYYIPDTDHPQSYVLVFPSLHFESRQIMEMRRFNVDTPHEICADFGIDYLDDMLPAKGKNRGIPFGKVGALLGSAATHKTTLGHAFLAQAFRNLANGLVEPALKPGECIDAKMKELLRETGAVVLITSQQDLDAVKLAEGFYSWLNVQAPMGIDPSSLKREFVKALVSRIVCRRLEIHDLSTSVLMHIVRQSINGAKKKLPVDEATGANVRIVIDDFNTWKEIYPDIREEPLFLPALLFHLRREKVAALILDSHQGRPDIAPTDPLDAELRALVDHRLYMWRVSFYGESRIAIASMVPSSLNRHTDKDSTSQLMMVREFKWNSQTDLHWPEVDPHFEMYAGLEEGKPHPVPLEIRMFTESGEFSNYVRELNGFLGELFSPVPGGNGIVRESSPADYNKLRDLCALQKNTRLDHTLVLPVDEFWSIARHEGFRLQKRYLDEITWKGDDKSGEGTIKEDPFGIFRPGLGGRFERKGKLRRIEFFRPTGYELTGDDGKACGDIDRLPFTWDFGFLMCKLEPWLAQFNAKIAIRTNEGGLKTLTVGEIWERLRKAVGFSDIGEAPDNDEDKETEGPRVSWREFLGACEVVARSHHDSGSDNAPPFDVSLTSAEGLSCLLLEIWTSEMYVSHKNSNTLKSLYGRKWLQNESELLKRLTFHSLDLFKAWLLLIDVLDLNSFADPANPFEPVVRSVNPDAIAARHWYKSACEFQADESQGPTIPVGLPGHFSVRGDWFLAVATASRSSRVADRALDLLSSRRANFVRMQLGLGLPTRDIADQISEREAVRTKLRGLVKTKRFESSAANRSAREYPRAANIAYAELLRLGESDNENFHWLWRSSLQDYDLLSTIWQKSLVRMAMAWQDLRSKYRNRWVTGFEMYDKLNSYLSIVADLTKGSETDPISDDARFGLLTQSRWEAEDRQSWEQFESTWKSFRKLCELTFQLFHQPLGGSCPSTESN